MGFWLYVWRVQSRDWGEFLYVGRTGDNSSPYATPIYQRMGQHFGRVKTQNALRRHLESHHLDLETCAFQLVAHGPIYPEQADMEKHLPIRNLVGAMEKALADELRAADYNVLNDVKWKHPLASNTWQLIRQEFLSEFPMMKQP